MKPFQNYIVCAVQRSGSSLLCEALTSTKLAGVPEEYFLLCKDSWWAQQHGISSHDAFLNLIIQKGMTSNGVFGCKIMWNCFGEIVDRLRELPSLAKLDDSVLMEHLFQNPKYIWVVRHDKVRQAVSWTIAAQAGLYASYQRPLPEQEPKFDFTMIDNLHRLIEVGEQGWSNYFERANVKPLTVVYEDFVANYDATIKQILHFLEIDYPDSQVFSPTTLDLNRQSPSRDEEWKSRYWEIKELQLNHLAYPSNGLIL